MHDAMNRPGKGPSLLDRLGDALVIWAGYCFARKWRVLLTAVLVAMLAGWFAASRLTVNTNPADMISAKLPYRLREAAFNENFPVLRNQIAVVVRAGSRDETAAFSRRLVTGLSRPGLPFEDVFAASIDPWFERNGLLYQEGAELDATMGALSRAAPLLKTLAADPGLDNYFAALADGVSNSGLALGDKSQTELSRALATTSLLVESRLRNEAMPLAWSNLFTGPPEQGFVQEVIAVRPKLDFTSLQPAKPALDALANAIAQARADPLLARVDVQVTGDPALRAEELKSVATGIGYSFAASILAVAILLGIALRSIRHTILLTGTLVWTIVVTAGIAAIFYSALNLVSMAFTVLLVGLGIDYAIHLYLVTQDHRRAGLDNRSALMTAIRELGPASALCALTTMLGFLVFVPTDFVGMAQLGVLGGVGVLIAMFSAFTFLPAGFALMPPAPAAAPKPGQAAPPRRTRLAIGLVLASVGALFALPFVHFDADPMALRDPQSPSVKAFARLFEAENQQPYRLSLVAKDQSEAATLAERARALPGVGRVITPADLTPAAISERRDVIDAAGQGVLLALEDPGPPPERAPDGGLNALNDALLGVASAEANQLRAALTRFMAARKQDPAIAAGLESDVFAFFPAQVERLKASLSPDWEIAFEDLPQFLQRSFRAESGAHRVEIWPKADLRDEKARSAFVAEVTNALPNATGPALNLWKAGEVVSTAMTGAILAAFGLCALILLLLLRDFRFTTAILVPVIMAGALVCAAGVLLDLPFNYANVIVLPLLIGAGVDSGIHLALRAKHAGGATAALATSTPRAVLFSALTTIASFGSLMFSRHQGVSGMGKLLVLALAATLLTTLFVQPLLLRLLGFERDEASKATGLAINETT